MLAVHQTAYSRLKSSYSKKELRLHYTPTEAELAFAYRYGQQDAMQIGYASILRGTPLRKTTYTCMKEAARKAAQTKEHLADIVNVMLEELVKQHYELPAFIRLTDAPSTRKGISTMSATSGLCEK